MFIWFNRIAGLARLSKEIVAWVTSRLLHCNRRSRPISARRLIGTFDVFAQKYAVRVSGIERALYPDDENRQQKGLATS
jgi:hypothetical protein